MAKSVSPVTKDKSPRAPIARYGIGEWYGHDLTTLSAKERAHFGRLSFAQASDVKKMSLEQRQKFWAVNFGRKYKVTDFDSPTCPFLSSLSPLSPCTKAGGVCSMRNYEALGDGHGRATPDASPTVCPFRFLENETLLRWVSEKMLGTSNPIVIKETPFLRKIATLSGNVDEDEASEEIGEGKKAGRIDWLLVDPDTADSEMPKWCAVETQGVYFSGAKWKNEFEAFAKDGAKLHYPLGGRRPDYRSNGPKRLAPQLSVKVPVLRAWGTKVAVIVDRYFYKEMADLQSAFPSARTDQDRLDRAEVVWFVADYNDQMQLVPGDVIYSDLAKSIEALNATRPIERRLFQQNLKAMLSDASRLGSKVFKLTDESK